MRRRLAISTAILVLVGAGIALGHMPGQWSCEGMRGPGMRMGLGMRGCGPMMQYRLGLAMPMVLLENIDYYLSYPEEIGLSDNQVRSLKSIRDSYQKETITKTAELETAMLELKDLLSEDQVDLSRTGALNKKIVGIQAELRLKGIQAYAKAKKVLTKEQLRRAKSLGAGYLEEEHRPMMMHR